MTRAGAACNCAYSRVTSLAGMGRAADLARIDECGVTSGTRAEFRQWKPSARYTFWRGKGVSMSPLPR